jgi:polygalacturonase
MLGGNRARREFLRLTGAGVVGVAAGQATLSVSAAPHAARAVYDIRDFGAIADGKTIDSPAINKCIEAAAAAGGGVAIFSPGTYLCYSIHLKSKVDLHLPRGATILAADAPSEGNANGYDPPEANEWDKYQDFGHSYWHNSLIWGEGVSNFSITGSGIIWGRGLSRGGGDKPLPAGVGNKSISLKNCHNVLLRDFSILHGGHFGILATGVDNLTIDNLMIDTNRDAIDIDCCRNVRVSNCSINSPWDDGICLKSSFGLDYARSTDHVTVTNCYVTGGYEEGTLLDDTYKPIGPEKAPRNGRIKFGTESNGGFRNITASNCVVEACRGVALESVDGALLEDISISNLTMRDLVDVPFFLRLGSRMRGPEGAPVGQLRRVNISNIVVSNCASHQASIITGIPGHYLEDIKFSDILVLHQGGGTSQDPSTQVQELEKVYPDPNRFGTMPAHGFFVRHVKGLSMHDVEVKYSKEDLRPAVLLEGVSGADFVHVKFAHAPDIPTFALKNVEGFALNLSRPLPDTYIDKVEQRTL